MRRNGKAILILILLIAAALFAAASYFLLSFYVPNEQAEVLGNVRYTDAEIRRMAMPGFKEHNSLYLRFFRNEIELPDVPFIDSIEVEYMGRNRVRLHANEEYPVGYLLQDGNRYYFNASGIVTESLADTALQEEEKDPENGVSQKEVKDPENVIIQEETEDPGSSILQEEGKQQTDSREPLVAETAGETVSSDTSFRPALADVSQVSGLVDTAPAVGEQIQVEDTQIFQTLQTLGKLINKLDIHPDEIQIDEDRTMTLRYGDVLVDLGTERLLDEKMSRAAVILPQLEGLKGTLHLETFSPNTINIIFSADQEEAEAVQDGMEGSETPEEELFTEEYSEVYTEEYDTY